MGAQAGIEADLIGRERELAAARRALEGGGGGILLVGEAGIGKTTLARATLAGLTAHEDPEILWLVASGSEPSIPFGVFAPFVPAIGGIPGRQPDPFFLLQTLRSAVLERAHGKPLILGVDDAHRLDGHSATLVYQLVAAGEARVVMATRAGFGAPAAVRSLWKEELVERIDLDPLGREATLAYARSLLEEGHIAGELAEALWRTSQGNPMYLRELVFAGRRSGRVVARDGVWRLDGELTVGPRLGELIQERLDTALSDEIGSLEVVAFADPLPLSVAERLVPAAHVADLQRTGLLSVERSRRELTVRMGHPLFAESLRESIPEFRRAELALELADSFEADGRLDAELLRVVAWRLDAGEPVPAAQLLTAALQAAERQDWPLSARLAEAAVAGGGDAEAVFALADARRALGQFRDALQALGDEQGSGDDQVARGAVLRAFILSQGLGRFGEADGVLEEAGRRVSDPSDRTWLDATRAGLLNFAGRPGDAVTRGRPLLERPDLSARAELTARAACALGMAWCGHPDTALEMVEDLPERVGDGGGWLPTLWIRSARLLAYRMSGRVADLEHVATRDYRMAVQLNAAIAQGRAAGELGWAALVQGHLDLAVARFREATTALGGVDSLGNRAHALMGLAEVLAQTGDPDGAAVALEHARPLAENAPAMAARWQIGSAWIAAAEGALNDALDRLGRAAELARRHGQTAYEMLALHASVRLGSGAPVDRLEEMERSFDNPLVVTMADHARALGTGPGSGDLLDGVAEVYAGGGLQLYAAEAAA